MILTNIQNVFCGEIKTKQALSYISICSLSIPYNSKFIIMATSLGTNAVIVTRVHCMWILYFSIPEYINIETSKIVFENGDRKGRGSISYSRSEGGTPRNGHVTFLPPLISTSGVASDLETETQITNGRSLLVLRYQLKTKTIIQNQRRLLECPGFK